MQTSSRNVLAVAMDLLGVYLLVVHLNSTQVQTGSRNVLAVASTPSRSIATASTLVVLVCTCTESK